MLKIPSTGEQSQITFIVRDDASTSAVVFQTSDTTWQAYNTYGGSNFYRGGANGRAYKLSYNRPFSTRGPAQRTATSSSPPSTRWCGSWSATATTCPTSPVSTPAAAGPCSRTTRCSCRSGTTSTGAAQQRANVEAARDAGVNLMFLSGNEMYWRTRWENSADSSHTAYRTLVSYKETWANGKIDPTPEWTGHLA